MPSHLLPLLWIDTVDSTSRSLDFKTYYYAHMHLGFDLLLPVFDRKPSMGREWKYNGSSRRVQTKNGSHAQDPWGDCAINHHSAGHWGQWVEALAAGEHPHPEQAIAGN